MATCEHNDMAKVDALSRAEKEVAVCKACVEMGSTWIHLRQCRTCGNVGCCDQSPNQHARKHFNTEDHPLITSAEPDETWSYSYTEDENIDLPVHP